MIRVQRYYMMQNASDENIRRILWSFGVEAAPKINTKGNIAGLKAVANPSET